MLRRGAAAAAGVWTVPVIESISRPAAAGSAPPSASVCRSQTFLVDSNGQLLTYTPGRDRSFLVDLGTAFAEITSITVRLHASALDPIASDEQGSVRFRKETQPNVQIGVIFSGPSNPVVLGFSPSGGHPPDQTYGNLLADGRAELIVAQSSLSPGSFTLTKVDIEVCGTPV
jgi:hypothetical protein